MASDDAGAGATPRRRTVRQAFVVTPARSGSTLLRYLLDSHPDVTSPPELNLSALLQHLVDVWRQTNTALGLDGDGEAPAPTAPLTPEVRRHARKGVDDIMVTAANAAGASLYCDKSLTTVDHLATVSQCYPKASLIFLYRYPLDMIASGLEASKWGFNAFGFAPFVMANPGNFVAALANYWIDKVSKMVEFERSCELAHARIYYELLCDDPAGTLAQLFEFLGLPADDQAITRAFAREHGRGPGDYKIDYSGAIATASIGRGSTLPELMGPEQVKRIDELLSELDYPALDAGRRGDLGALLGLKRAAEPTGDGNEIARSLVDRLAARPSLQLSEMHRQNLPVKLVIRAGAGEPPVVLLNPDGSARIIDADGARDTSDDQPQNGPVPRVRCLGDVLMRVVEGKATFVEAVHQNLISVEVNKDAEQRPGMRPNRVLATVAAFLRPRP